MNKWILPILTLFLINCKGEQTVYYFTSEKAVQYFKSIEEICNKDNGKLWGIQLYGPVMFVERTSRRIFANQPDNEGFLKEQNGIYLGFFPKERIISTSPVIFGGTLFAMVPLPVEEDEYRIKTRAIHSLFHLFQETSGFPATSFNINNMDEKEARLWIKLEWKALRRAINSEGEARQVSIRDALIFRGSNRELYQKFADDENSFETYEGLATFTYTLLCTNSYEEYKTRLLEYLSRVYAMESYPRVYGLVHGALYATLLYEKGFDLKTIHTENFDLGDAVKKVYNIQLPAVCRDVAGSIAMNYEIDVINSEEEKRLSDIRERIHKQISTFIEKPVVFLELESPYFDFEPENILSLDTLGTLYNSMRISDNWGKLTVDKGGCLVSNNLKYLRISAKGFQEDKNHVSGDGWNLILNDNWELVSVDQNFFVRKLMP